MSNSWVWAWTSAVLAVLLLHLMFLVRFPAHVTDESWMADASWSWITTSVNVDSMHEVTVPKDAVGRTRFFLGQLPTAILFRLGGLGFLQARLASWIVGALLLGLLFLTTTRLYDRETGALAAALLVVSPSFTSAAHLARQDGLLALLGLLVFLVATEAFRTDRFFLHGLAGLGAGLTLDVHQNGLTFVVALIALYAVVLGKDFFFASATRAAGLGGLAAFGVFFCLHLWPDPRSYFDAFGYDLSSGHQMPILAASPVRLIKSLFLERQKFSLDSDSIGFVLMVTAVGFVASRRNAADLRVLAFLGGGFLASVLFVGKKDPTYAILSTPLIYAALAATFVAALRSVEGGKAKRVVAILLGTFMLVRVLVLVDLAIDNRRYDYDAIASRIDRALPKEDVRVMALPTWWLGLNKRSFTSTHNFVYGIYGQGLSFDQVLGLCSPDVLIVDDELRQSLHDPSTSIGPRRPFDLPRSDFDALTQGALVLDSFVTPEHGLIEVLKLRERTP